MEMLPSKLAATPRLLSSLTAPPSDKPDASDADVSGARLSRSGVFCGSSRWWFIGIFVGGAIVIASAHTFHERYIVYREHQRQIRMMEVETHRLADAPHSMETPQPVMIKYSPEMLQVTAIALGHPRLAVINGRTLTEGDNVVLHTPTHNVAVTLRVATIGDGYVDLSDGMHNVTAHLIVPSMKRP